MSSESRAVHILGPQGLAVVVLHDGKPATDFKPDWPDNDLIEGADAPDTFTERVRNFFLCFVAR